MSEWKIGKIKYEGKILNIACNGEFLRVRQVGKIPLEIKLVDRGEHINEHEMLIDKIINKDEVN